MKITAVRVDGFGIWKGVSIGDLSASLNVFYGRNEAGKTTLMQFVRTVLYGFSPERRDRYLAPLHGERAGGALRLTVAGQGYEVARRWDATDDPASLGEVTVTADDGTREGPARLGTLLAGVDESIFNNVFAVGLREMQELASLNDTAAAEQLYKLTGGLDRVSLVDVMRELEASRQRMLSSDDRPSQIVQFLNQWEKLQGEIEDLASHGERWSQLVTLKAALQQEIAAGETSIARLEQQARQLEVALQVSDRWQTRGMLEQQLSEIGPLPPLPERAMEKLDRWNAKLASRQEQASQLRRQRAGLRQEAAALAINRALWAQAPRIEALAEHAPWMASLQQKIDALRAEVAQCEKELGTYCEQVGASQPASLASLPAVPRRKLSLLREPARTVAQEQRRLNEAKEEMAKASNEAAKAAQELEMALVERDQTNLAAALEQAGDLAGKLRRRIHLEDRIDQMLRRRTDLEEETLDLRENQVLPRHVLAGIGALFVLGVMLILTGFFGGLLWSLSGALGWSLLGCVVTGGAVAAKFMLERRAASRLEDCVQQFDSLQNQLQQAQRERDSLDRELPSGGGQLDSRLHDAEADIEALETLLPLDTRHQAAHDQAQEAKAVCSQAEIALKTARQRWRGVLRSIGLPEDVTLKQAQQFTRGCNRTARLRKRREARLEDCRKHERDLAAIATRIEQLMQEAGLTPVSEDPPARLRQLLGAVAQQRQAVKRRSSLKRQDRALRREQAKHRLNMENLRRRKQALIAFAGAEDERQLRQSDERRRRAAALAQQRDDVTAQIAAALGREFTEEAISAEISRHGPGKLNERRDELAAQVDCGQTQLAQLFERRGEISQEMKSLAADRRLAEARLELGCVGERLKEAIGRWQVLAVTGRLLESIRELYETERQPETLNEASRYLRKLTLQRYTRVWTPLGEQVLKVDDEHGNALPLAVLSSGTREAVFLSLRLALAAAYARRGTTLPLVLDDVLVNFDTPRARAAAEVLAEFSGRGFQLLLFTCHEHLVDIFRHAKVEVRQLPAQGQSALIMPVDKEHPAVGNADPGAGEPAPKESPSRKRRRKHADEAPPEPNLNVAAEPSGMAVPLRVHTSSQPIPAAAVESPWDNGWWVESWDDDCEALVQDVVREDVPPKLPPRRKERRFTWDSPEIYWHGRSEEAA